MLRDNGDTPSPAPFMPWWGRNRRLEVSGWWSAAGPELKMLKWGSHRKAARSRSKHFTTHNIMAGSGIDHFMRLSLMGYMFTKKTIGVSDSSFFWGCHWIFLMGYWYNNAVSWDRSMMMKVGDPKDTSPLSKPGFTIQTAPKKNMMHLGTFLAQCQSQWSSDLGKLSLLFQKMDSLWTFNISIDPPPSKPKDSSAFQRHVTRLFHGPHGEQNSSGSEKEVPHGPRLFIMFPSKFRTYFWNMY